MRAEGGISTGFYFFRQWQLHIGRTFVAKMVKNPPAMQETWVGSLGWEDPLKEGMATHSSILAWRFPCEVAKSWIRLSD